MSDLERFWKEQGEWSQATFGPDTARGPTGPLRHLAREVLTELLGVPRWATDEALARTSDLNKVHSEPAELLEEMVDAQFLIIDAARRAGFTYDQFVAALFAKLVKNKARKWPAFDPNNINEAVEHDRSADPKPTRAPHGRMDAIGDGPMDASADPLTAEESKTILDAVRDGTARPVRTPRRVDD